MINARPHINGNTPGHFVEAAGEIEVALDALSHALSRVMTDVMHGRNYQHIGPDQWGAISARNRDEERLRGCYDAIAQLRQLADDIVAASGEHSNRDQNGNWTGEVANENGWTP